MKTAAENLQDRLASVVVNTPHVPVVHNVDVNCYDDPLKIKEALVRQLYQPVRWVDCINKMIADGATEFVECGPGKVLAGLNKRIARRTDVFPVYDTESLEKALA